MDINNGARKYEKKSNDAAPLDGEKTKANARKREDVRTFTRQSAQT